MSNKVGFGWVPDGPDFRDYRLAFLDKTDLPDQLDLRGNCPPIYNQGPLGSCTAQAVCGLLHFTEREEKPKPKLFIPSRLFHYYYTRLAMGTVDYDSGASIREAVRTAVRLGFCKEDLWKYDVSKFKQKPPEAASKAAAPNALQNSMYARVRQDLVSLQTALSEFNPVVFGFSVYESFMSSPVAKTGLVPMPKGKEQMLGGHAILLVGYDNVRQLFIARNSWGTTWGDKGYCYMPYAFITSPDFARDFWTITDIP